MTNARLTHYHRLLLDAPRIFSKPVSLNPATLLPNPDLEAPLHDCPEIIAEITQVRPDLQDSALLNSELVWYTDRSSFLSDGVCKAGAAVVDQGGNIIWSAPLPPGTSAQKAELIALAEALKRAEGKQVTVGIYTDSHYAFSTVHVHGAIYRERGFITAEGKKLRNLPEIQGLLIAVQKPQAAAIVHVPGHQSSQDSGGYGEPVSGRGGRKCCFGLHDPSTDFTRARASALATMTRVHPGRQTVDPRSLMPGVQSERLVS
jgi:ribonuclease HI